MASAVFVLFVSVLYGDNAVEYFGGLLESSYAITDPNKSDIGRNLATRAGFETVLDNPKRLIIGDGIHSHKTVTIPFVEKLYARYMPADDFHIPGSRDDAAGGIQSWNTTAFIALLVDTGLFGIALFMAVIMLNAKTLMVKRFHNRDILVFVVGMCVLWLYINNISDIVLFYLMVMPHGLIQRLGYWNTVEPSTATHLE